ncbi:MAG TPA: hypothetical protein DCR35_13665 [Runella sp.]|nr:hypothetical protein [Runella sp.]
MHFTAVKISEKKDVSVKTSVKTSVKILALMRKIPEITIPALAKETGVTIRSVERAIEKLKKENKIERIGPDNGGYWKVL